MIEDEMPKPAQKAEILPAKTDTSPPMLLRMAVAGGAAIDVIERLAALAERYEDRQRQQQFNEDFVKAKARIPTMLKNRVVDFSTAKGRTRYKHADLAEIMETISPILAEHNLAASFEVNNTADQLTVSCLLVHSNGHSERRATLTGQSDMSGNKNALQGLGSAQTFLSRYSISAALGLAASEDDDARSTVNDPTLTEDQVNELEKLIPDSGVMNLFMDWVRKTSDPLASSVGDIKQSFYKTAFDTLDARKRKNEEKAK